MSKSGWFHESWRHSLAARGMRTKYMMGKVPKRYFQEQAGKFRVDEGDGEQEEEVRATPGLRRSIRRFQRQTGAERRLRQLRAERKLEQEKREQELEKTEFGILLRRAKEGDFEGISEGLDDLSGAQKRAIQAALNEQAVEQARAGLVVPDDIRARLSPAVKQQVAAIEREQKIAARGTGARVAAELGERAAVGSERFVGESVFEGGRFVREAFEESSGADSASGRRELQRVAPKFENVFLGDGVDGIGKGKDDGKLTFFDELDSSVSLSDAIVPKEKPRPIDFGMEQTAQSVAERVQREVDSLFDARVVLGKTDVSGFVRGERAFREGKREELIAAINDLEFEVEKQRNRWNVVEQTRAQVESPQTRSSVMENAGVLSVFGARGGKQIADMTSKVNEVKQSIKQGADEAKGRASVLRKKLQQLDAVTPPLDGVPEQEPQVFGKGSSGSLFVEPMETVGKLLRSGDEGASRQV